MQSCYMAKAIDRQEFAIDLPQGAGLPRVERLYIRFTTRGSYSREWEFEISRVPFDQVNLQLKGSVNIEYITHTDDHEMNLTNGDDEQE